MRACGICLTLLISCALAGCGGAGGGGNELPVVVPSGLYQSEASYVPALATAAGNTCLPLIDAARNGRAVQVQLRHPANAPGARPVVVFSHGGGPRERCGFGNSEWGAVLTGAGYTVVHISHNLDSATQNRACAAIGVSNCSMNEAMQWLRPNDAGFVIDQLPAIAAAFGLGDRVDTTRVGAAGHSFGAYTAMTAAGARVDLGALVDHSFAHPGIDSVLALSPQGPDRFGFFDRGLGGNSWDALRLPVMTQTGLNDDIGGETAVDRRLVFGFLPPPDKFEAFINDPRARHNSFNLDDGLTPPQFTGWIAAAGVAWFDATLRERAEAWAWLASSELVNASAGVVQVQRKDVAAPAGR